VAHAFSIFLLDGGSRLDDTTPVRKRGVTGFAFPGGRPFAIYKGSGFWRSLDSMANKLIRIYGRGHLHFITFTCYRRLPLLRSVRARNVFVRILGEVRDRYEFSLVGYVVMPEHIHLLISEPVRGTPSTAIQVLKQRVSRQLRRKKRTITGQLNLGFASSDDFLPRFWQRRFYDFNVWSLKKRVEKLHYMHMNPMKRKLVDHPKDWPWSSFPFYSNLKRGLIRVDPVS
jgi:putative transposase